MPTENRKFSDKLLTVGQTAIALNMSVRSVRRLIAKHGLPVIRYGRIVRVHPSDLDRFVAAHRFE